jgi:hypothetical protein
MILEKAIFGGMSYVTCCDGLIYQQLTLVVEDAKIFF